MKVFLASPQGGIYWFFLICPFFWFTPLVDRAVEPRRLSSSPILVKNGYRFLTCNPYPWLGSGRTIPTIPPHGLHLPRLDNAEPPVPSPHDTFYEIFSLTIDPRRKNLWYPVDSTLCAKLRDDVGPRFLFLLRRSVFPPGFSLPH